MFEGPQECFPGPRSPAVALDGPALTHSSSAVTNTGVGPTYILYAVGI